MPIRPEFSGTPGTTVPLRDDRPFRVRFRFALRAVWYACLTMAALIVWPHAVAWERGVENGAGHARTASYVVYDGIHTRLVTRPFNRHPATGIDLMTSVEYGVSGDPSRTLPMSDVVRLLRLCTVSMYEKDEMCQRAAISAPSDIMETNIDLVRHALLARLPSAYWYAQEDALRSYMLEDCSSHWWEHLDDFECRSAAIGARYVAAKEMSDAALTMASSPK
jgi:hypothetical protein